MKRPDPQLRYGAFVALRSASETHEAIRGVRVNDSFWLHHVAADSEPMVHVSTDRRAEIVLFGTLQPLKGQFSVPAGPGLHRRVEGGRAAGDGHQDRAEGRRAGAGRGAVPRRRRHGAEGAGGTGRRLTPRRSSSSAGRRRPTSWPRACSTTPPRGGFRSSSWRRSPGPTRRSSGPTWRWRGPAGRRGAGVLRPADRRRPGPGGADADRTPSRPSTANRGGCSADEAVSYVSG